VFGESSVGFDERFVDVLLTVGEADEPQTALDGADALFEETGAEMRPAWGILAADVVAVVVDRAFGSTGLEHDSMEGWAGALWAEWDAVLVGERTQATHELLAEVERNTRMVFAQTNNVIEAPLRGGEAEGIAIQCASVDDAAFDDLLHRRLFANERREGHAAADGFAQNGEVGREAEIFLSTAWRESEAGDGFIGNHEHAVAIT
jgi:hypothetical protein